jgi:hypothetical protein
MCRLCSQAEAEARALASDAARLRAERADALEEANRLRAGGGDAAAAARADADRLRSTLVALQATMQRQQAAATELERELGAAQVRLAGPPGCAYNLT